jgi:hypothetical protein
MTRTGAFYIKYCKILNNVIKEAKKQHYSRSSSSSEFIGASASMAICALKKW